MKNNTNLIKIKTNYKKKLLSFNQIKLDRLYKISKNFNLLKNKYDTITFLGKPIKNIVVIRITPNNTIITLTDIKGDVSYKITAGKLGLQSSKKNYRIIYNLVLSAFLKHLKKEKKKKYLLFKLIAPRTIKKRLIRRLKFYIKAKSCNKIELIRKLPFNGCRPPKLRRKKRKGLRILKPQI